MDFLDLISKLIVQQLYVFASATHNELLYISTVLKNIARLVKILGKATMSVVPSLSRCGFSHAKTRDYTFSF